MLKRDGPALRALDAALYVSYAHKSGRNGRFLMQVPSRRVPWRGGWMEYEEPGVNDAECRCGLVKRAVFYASSGAPGVAVALKILDRKAVKADADS